MIINSAKRYFSFFGKQISDKYGKKCCRYHQDGLPMPAQRVKQTLKQLQPFIVGWHTDPALLSLYRYFYCEDYLLAVQFLKDVAKIDALEFKNCPGFELKLGELLKVELQSPPIKGLSQVDFQLAMKINQMKFEQYSLIAVEDPLNYRKEVAKLRMERQAATFRKMLEDEHQHGKQCKHD